MSNNYKYDPNDYKNVLGLASDLGLFYKLYEVYLKDNTQSNRFALEKQGEELFFTLKHRRLEGAITIDTARDLRDYMEELMYD